MDKIGVLLVDAHEIVRQGLRTFLELQACFEVAGEGANGMEAVALVAQPTPDCIKTINDLQYLNDILPIYVDRIAVFRQLQTRI